MNRTELTFLASIAVVLSALVLIIVAVAFSDAKDDTPVWRTVVDEETDSTFRCHDGWCYEPRSQP